MPEARLAQNVEQDDQDWYALGSLPVGSWVELWNVDATLLVYRGYIVDQRVTWGYTIVQPITEGDGNFIGEAETWSVDKIRWDGNKKIVDHISNGTLARIYSMSDRHYVQAESAVRWLGVDEDLVAELEPEVSGDGRGQSFQRMVSLVPTVSLIVEVE